MPQRPLDFRLNYQSPLAKGLVFAGLGRHPRSKRYTDSSLFKNTGTLTNMAIPGTATSGWEWSSELGRYVLLGDGTGYVSFGDSPWMDKSFTAFGITFWFKYLSNPFLAGKMGGAGNRGWQISYHSPTLAFTYFDGPSGTEHNVSYSWPGIDTNWHHLKATFRASQYARLYIDGNIVATDPSPLAALNGSNSKEFRLFDRGDSTINLFVGSLSDAIVTENPESLEALSADPSNAMLSGLILPPARRLWATAAVAPGIPYWVFPRSSQIIGGGVA